MTKADKNRAAGSAAAGANSAPFHRLYAIKMFVEHYFCQQSVEKTMEKTGQKLKGIPIIVQLTEAEETTAAANSAAAGANGAPFHRLYVIQMLAGHWFCQESVAKTLENPGQKLKGIPITVPLQ